MNNRIPVGNSEWRALEENYSQTKELSLRDLFASDGGRAERFALSAAGLHLDYSKNRVTPETMQKLVALAGACNLGGAIKDMFDGVRINQTEGRPVLHTALRNTSGAPVLVNGRDVTPDVQAVLAKMSAFVRVDQECGQYRHRRFAFGSFHGM
jgi:glucose-6-phosphate isomerase